MNRQSIEEFLIGKKYYADGFIYTIEDYYSESLRVIRTVNYSSIDSIKFILLPDLLNLLKITQHYQLNYDLLNELVNLYPEYII